MSERPKSLDAFNIWQATSDIIRDDIYNGGIQETAFVPYWLAHAPFQDPDTPPTFGMSFTETPYDPVRKLTPFEIPPVFNVENINIPALVAATWSTQGLHSRGSFEGSGAWMSTIAGRHRNIFTSTVGKSGVSRTRTKRVMCSWSFSIATSKRTQRPVTLERASRPA